MHFESHDELVLSKFNAKKAFIALILAQNQLIQFSAEELKRHHDCDDDDVILCLQQAKKNLNREKQKEFELR